MSATKITTILVTHAAHELGVSQEQFRQWLKPFYKNWEKVKRIKYEYYTTIAESIAERVQELESQKQESEVQQEIEPPIETQDNGGTTSSLTVVDESDENTDANNQSTPPASFKA